MTKLTLDPQLREKLNGLDEQIEVCDETGKTVGHFLPEAIYRKFVYAWLNAQVTDEELERLAPEKSRDIDLRRFVEAEAIPPMYFERSYFLVPAGGSAKAFSARPLLSM